MSNYFPLIVDASGNVGVMKELPAADNLDFTSSGIVNLNVGNLQLLGGANGEVLTTDGTGNLSFVAFPMDQISNGTSNVSIATSNGNITNYVNGTLSGTFTNSLGPATLPGVQVQAIGDGTSFIYWAGSAMYFYPNGIQNAFELSNTGAAVFKYFIETQVTSPPQSGPYNTWPSNRQTKLSSGSVWVYPLGGNIDINTNDIISGSNGTIVQGTSWTWILENSLGYSLTSTQILWAGGNKTLTTGYNIISFYYDGTNLYASLTNGYAP